MAFQRQCLIGDAAFAARPARRGRLGQGRRGQLPACLRDPRRTRRRARRANAVGGGPTGRSVLHGRARPATAHSSTAPGWWETHCPSASTKSATACTRPKHSPTSSTHSPTAHEGAGACPCSNLDVPMMLPEQDVRHRATTMRQFRTPRPHAVREPPRGGRCVAPTADDWRHKRAEPRPPRPASTPLRSVRRSPTRHAGGYERDVVHREAPTSGVDTHPDAFQQFGQLALRNGAAARLQRVQPLVTRVGLGPPKPPLLRFIERASCPHAVGRWRTYTQMRLFWIDLFPGNERLRQDSAIDLARLRGPLAGWPVFQNTVNRPPGRRLARLRHPPGPPNANSRRRFGLSLPGRHFDLHSLCRANSASRASGSTPSTWQPAFPRHDASTNAHVENEPSKAPATMRSIRTSCYAAGPDHNARDPTRTIPLPAAGGVRARSREQTQPEIGARSLWICAVDPRAPAVPASFSMSGSQARRSPHSRMGVGRCEGPRPLRISCPHP